MNILITIYQTVLEALFPTSSAEKELFSYTPEQVYTLFPHVSDYSGLAIPLPNVHSIYTYKDPRVTQLVWNIKYKKSKRAIEIAGYAFGRQLESQFDMFNKENSETIPRPTLLIVPIPISIQRRKERGYNQCELITDELKQRDTHKRFLVIQNLLIRTHHASRQTLKDRSERLQSAQGIFDVNEKVLKHMLNINPEIQHIPIVIIDDVITTGSTMKEAIDALEKAGFTQVHGLSLAH